MRAHQAFDGAVPLGIQDGLFVSHGDHIAYFWESESDFARGVKFLPSYVPIDEFLATLPVE